MTEGLFDQLVRRVAPLDQTAAGRARDLQDCLTKPSGSLGQLEDLSVQLAAIAGVCPAPVPEPVAVAVFAGDHGVAVTGVSPWPQEVTAQMVANFCEGGAAINVLARHVGASVTVVDVGVATPLSTSSPMLQRRNVARGTANLADGPAMTAAQVAAALDVGATVGTELVEAGARLLVTGDMGIGNTTSSAALIAALTATAPERVTGRGTGIDDATLRRKIAVIEGALARLPVDATPAQVVAQVGGLEIAALAGFIMAAAAARVPVVLDGVIAVAAAVVAAAWCDDVRGYLIGGHLSREPGARVGLDFLGIAPVIDLDLRLGEGSGAALAVPIVQASAKILREMATFESAQVTERHEE